MHADWVRQACEYLGHGISVIPVNGKVAAVKWEPYQSRKMTPAEIQRNFRSPVVSGIAGIMGAVSGDLACRDFDVPESYEAWRAAFPELSTKLTTSKTPRGYHVLFRYPGCRTVHLGDGELRGAGGYCVLPESVVNGKAYTWIKKIGHGDKILTINPSEAGLSQPWVGLNTGGSRGSETQAVSKLVNSQNKIESIEQAVAIALPDGPHQNHARVLILGRALKKDLAKHLGRSLREQEYLEAFGLWYDANDYLRPGQSRAEYLIEFLEAVERARYALGEGKVLEEAWETAVSAEPPNIPSLADDPRLLLLASFCRELQRWTGEKEFFLACRDVQEKF